MTIRIDPDFAAKQIVDNLRAMECDGPMAREILKLCEAKIKKGELRRDSWKEDRP